MHYQEQSKSSLLSPLTGYFLWAFLPKEPGGEGEMGWFYMLCKHVYLGSWQCCALHAATSAPAPARHGTGDGPNAPSSRDFAVSPAATLVSEVPQARGESSWSCLGVLSALRTLGVQRSDLGAAARFALQIKEEGGHPYSASLCIQLARSLMG